MNKKNKNSLNFYSSKVQRFHSVSVKNESASAKQLKGGGVNRPPPAQHD